MDYGLPGSSVHGISQARILEWVAIPFSRGSSQPRDPNCVSCTGSWVIYNQATWEVPKSGCLSFCYWLERVLYVFWVQVPIDQPFKTSTCFSSKLHISVHSRKYILQFSSHRSFFFLLYNPFPSEKEFALMHSLLQESKTPDTTDPEQNQLSSNSDPAALTFKKTVFSSSASHPFKVFSSAFLPAKHSKLGLKIPDSQLLLEGCRGPEKETNLEFDCSAFKYWPCHLPAVCLQANWLTSLSPTFFNYQRENKTC